MSESSIDDLNRVYQVNVMGLLLAIRVELAAMKSQEARAVSKSNPLRGQTRGVVPKMGSVASCYGVPEMSAYVASKHAVLV